MSEKGPRQAGWCPVPGMRPGVGFSPQMPAKCAGTRIDPPPSLPMPPAEQPAAMAADSPPLDSAGRVLEPPRVRRPAVQRVVRLVPHQHFGHVRRAEDDGACGAQPRDDDRVAGGDDPLARRTPGFAPEPGDLDRALDRDGQPAERPARQTARGLGVLRARLGERRLSAQVHERVELRLQARDLLEVRRDDAGRRDVPVGDGPDDVDGGCVEQGAWIGHQDSSPCAFRMRTATFLWYGVFVSGSQSSDAVRRLMSGPCAARSPEPVV